MPTIRTRYLGDLRTEAIHVASGQRIITDAPLDNQGKGEAFSPSDALCSALCSCMITLMGIAARTHKIALDGLEAETTKYMASDPRRVAKIEIRFFHFPAKLSEKEQLILQRAAHTCPVALSIHPDIKQLVTFEFP